MEKNIDNQVRAVTFIEAQRGQSKDLYYCNVTGNVYIRQEYSNSHVCWFTASKWVGGYENDCHMKSGLVIQVVDKTGRVLFEEKLLARENGIGTWAQKNGPFSWETITAMAEEYKKKLRLSTYEEWKERLIADAKLCKFEGYSDNWLFAMVTYGAYKKISQLNILGVIAYATVREEMHKICGKSWLCYEIKDASLDSTLAICGYKFLNNA